MAKSHTPFSHRLDSGPRQPRSSGSSHRDRRIRHQPFAGEHEVHHKRRALRGHLVAMSGEFVGTVLFLWFAFAGTQVAGLTSENSDIFTPAGVMLVAVSFGFSLLVSVWALYRISGGLFNPAITLAMILTGNLPWLRGLLLIPAQLVGGIAAAGLTSAMLPGPLGVITTLGHGTSITQGVFIEMFLTALLVFVVLMLAAEKHRATFVAPVAIGLALFVAMIAGLPFTGASLNPARSFGPSVVAGSFPHYHYIYWFGPVMGALLAAGYYKFVKAFDYEDANPGQDARGEREAQLEKRASGAE